jgi:hypothetical protein
VSEQAENRRDGQFIQIGGSLGTERWDQELEETAWVFRVCLLAWLYGGIASRRAGSWHAEQNQIPTCIIIIDNKQTGLACCDI